MGRTLDQILASEKPEVIKEAKSKAETILLNIHLAEIRTLMQKTQMDMATALGLKQPTIAGMEKAGKDLKLSTLKRYIEAAGGGKSSSILSSRTGDTTNSLYKE